MTSSPSSSPSSPPSPLPPLWDFVGRPSGCIRVGYGVGWQLLNLVGGGVGHVAAPQPGRGGLGQVAAPPPPPSHYFPVTLPPSPAGAGPSVLLNNEYTFNLHNRLLLWWYNYINWLLLRTQSRIYLAVHRYTHFIETVYKLQLHLCLLIFDRRIFKQLCR